MSSPQIGDNTSPTSFVNPEPLPDRFSAVQGLFRQTVSSFQRQTLSQCLVDAEGDLKTYQAEINRLKARMIALEMRRDRLDETITNYRSLLSPICRMPIEILGHIFSFCCETNHISDLDSAIVIVFSAVCGHWRGIVLATPRLWSSMTLNLQEAECIEDEDYTCRLMNLFMARSRKELLDLEFYGVEAEAFEHFEAGFHCLLEHSNRWRSVAFPGDDPCWLNQPTSPFRHLEGRCLPNLEHLFLNFCTDSGVSDDDGDRMASDLALFSKSPKLNSIHIRGGTLPSGCRFPWAQIQSLRLSDYEDSNLGHMMTLCRNVRRLELERVDTDPDDLESPTDLNTTLEKLQSVSVRDSEGDALMAHCCSGTSLSRLYRPSIFAVAVFGSGHPGTQVPW
ncbi:hypothetical protein E1B28_007071 [Marasmius oreades]|uniref:F-box domain-containing protein n=1 Tax=Marasmius oreades TaxID=181124 RepID=A0A9P7S157_9AGAR|nr:uncharacterized protein E1B28_007071 [Marasmius oreades]KAG7093390.1 hypothetical protein E1B28_007071 [Marasmius oreades]